MEITCQQCSTVFTIDPGMTPGSSVEVVCPGCFQLQVVAVPGAKGGGPAGAGSDAMLSSPLGEGRVADRLRDGFTLAFEVRHPSWAESRKLNPFEIKRLIYQREFDGHEEFRENQGQWYPIGEHPEFALVFQLIGQPVKVREPERGEANLARFAGWKGVPRRPLPLPLEPVQEDLELPLALPSTRKSWWIAGIGAGVAAVVGAVIALLMFR